MRPIPFQTLSPFGSPRLRRPRAVGAGGPSSPAAFGSAAGQGFFAGATPRERQKR